MRGYILLQREHFRRLGIFCSMAGKGGRNTILAMADLCDKFPVASMCLRQREVVAGRHLASVREFAGELATLRRAQPSSQTNAGGATVTE